MFKSSAALGKGPPSGQWPPVPEEKVQKKEKAPADALLSDLPGNKPTRNASTLGQELAQYLESSPSPEGVIERLSVMAHFGIHTLDLSRQVLSAEAVLLLSEVLKTRPMLLGNFVAFNFADARFDTVRPLLEVLQQHEQAFFESLDFSGTAVLSADATTGAVSYASLEEADLRRVVAIVKGHARTLLELKLNQQTGLSPALDARQFDHVIDPSSPMFALASALHQSAVETLELRDCELWASDVNYLDPHTLFRGQPPADFRLRVIDLRGNDKIFCSFDSPVLQVEMVVGQAVGLASNPLMRELHLPAKALGMLDSGEGVAKLVRALEQKASGHLFKLEPFSSSGAERFMDLHRLLKGHKIPVLADQETLRLLASQKPLPPVPKEPLPQARLDIVQSPGLSDTNVDGETADVPVEPLNASTAGRQAATSLERGGGQGMREFGQLMARMRDAGIKTLDFSCQRLSAKAVDRLVVVLERALAHKADWVTELNFSGAEFGGLEGLRYLIEALERIKGGAIVSLDFSGTCVGVQDASGVTAYQSIPLAVLLDIVGLAPMCPSLRVLKLNRQPCLSMGDSEWNEIDSLYWLFDLVANSGLETLEIRACVRTFPNQLPTRWREAVARGEIEEKKARLWRQKRKMPSAPVLRKKLRFLDLRGNEAAFSGDARQVCLHLMHLAKRLGDWSFLQEVLLPSSVLDRLNPGDDDKVFELLFALMESGHPHRFTLQLESFREEGVELGLEDMLDVLSTTDIHSSIVSSSSSDVYLRLHGSLSALCMDRSSGAEERRRCLIEAIGRSVVHCFKIGDAQGAIKRLLFSADLGIKTLCLKAATLGEQELVCLAHVLHEEPRAFTSFDFSEASVDVSLSSLIATLARHLSEGGDIESLDFSGTTICTTSHTEQAITNALSAADLIRIVHLVVKCRSLRELKLDRQPQLSRSKTQRVRLFCTPADWPMMALVEALERGAVERLSLQACDLQFEDLQQIYAYALPVKGASSTMRFIDLSGNSQLLGDARALNTVIRIIKDAPKLRELHLPWEAAKLFNNNLAIRKLEAMLLKLRLTSPLAKLEPLSSSPLKSYATIQGLLADNQPSPKH